MTEQFADKPVVVTAFFGGALERYPKIKTLGSWSLTGRVADLERSSSFWKWVETKIQQKGLSKLVLRSVTIKLRSTADRTILTIPPNMIDLKVSTKTGVVDKHSNLYGTIMIDDENKLHSMTYLEREDLKSFASQGKSLELVLIIISNWMRCDQDVTFSGYAANWAVANNQAGVEAIRKKWPLNGPRMMADGSTDWGSAIPEA